MRAHMDALTFAVTGRVAGHGRSVDVACRDIFQKHGPLQEYHLIRANGDQPERATHGGPIQDLTLVTRGGNLISKLKYKKLKLFGVYSERYLVVSVSSGFRFMTPHKQLMVRRARRLWRARRRRPDKPNDRRWFREALRKPCELRNLGNMDVSKHLSEIAEYSRCFAFTTVLGAALKNWNKIKEGDFVCQVCDSSAFLCHCGWCQRPLFYTDKGNLNCCPQGVRRLVCCEICSVHHYANYAIIRQHPSAVIAPGEPFRCRLGAQLFQDTSGCGSN